MPWKVAKRACKQKTSGKAGTHVVLKKKKGGGTEQESCHTDEKKADAAARARYASYNESRTIRMPISVLRKIIKESILLKGLGN